MKKIRCPHCAVINLEKFVTFPFCAGCGARLPEFAGAVPESRWQRPLRPLLLAIGIGCATFGLIEAITILQTPIGETAERHLVVYSETPHHARLGELVTTQMTFDLVIFRPARAGAGKRAATISDTAVAQPGGAGPLEEVSLRLPGSLFRDFHFVSLRPRPDSIGLAGNVRYYTYNSLPRLAKVRLSLRAMRLGRHPINVMVNAQNAYPARFYDNITVAPATPLGTGSSQKNRQGG